MTSLHSVAGGPAQDVPAELIEKALALCGKTIEDMREYGICDGGVDLEFSIEKFCYFLLSPSFIEKFAFIFYEWSDDEYNQMASKNIGKAIYEYQKGNLSPLILLLQKI